MSRISEMLERGQEVPPIVAIRLQGEGLNGSWGAWDEGGKTSTPSPRFPLDLTLRSRH